MPLVEAWCGSCCAGGEPDAVFQRELCNFGYARGRCASFPDTETADAVRFTYVRKPGEVRQLVWVLERAWAPVSHGEWSEGAEAPAAVHAQAPAYIRSWHSRNC